MTLILDQELVLEEIFVPGYEKIVKVTNKKAGLNALICLHNLNMGPALGGIRIYPYTTMQAALNDGLRLSKGMTYKSAVAECGWGGGKSVIIADPKKHKTKELLLSFGQAVNRLKGEYICAEDVGCSPEDMLIINQETRFVVGLPCNTSSGNPSPFTAWGTYRGMQAVLKKLYKSDSLENRVVAIQGLGSVGCELAKMLFWAGARLVVCDIDPQKTKQIAEMTGASVVSPEEILQVECAILAPCAMGGTINAQTIPSLRCRAIAGCANNQLLEDVDGDALVARGILYAPDFVINAGGLINVSQELEPVGYRPSTARNKIHLIYDQLMVIFDIAEQNGWSTHQAAVSLGDYRLKYRIGKRIEPPCFHNASGLRG